MLSIFSPCGHRWIYTDCHRSCHSTRLWIKIWYLNEWYFHSVSQTRLAHALLNLRLKANVLHRIAETEFSSSKSPVNKSRVVAWKIRVHWEIRWIFLQIQEWCQKQAQERNKKLDKVVNWKKKSWEVKISWIKVKLSNISHYESYMKNIW